MKFIKGNLTSTNSAFQVIYKENFTMKNQHYVHYFFRFNLSFNFYTKQNNKLNGLDRHNMLLARGEQKSLSAKL